MPVDVTTEIDINRPRERVAAYASDPDNAPVWYENIQSVEWKTPKPMKVGSQFAFVARFLGRRIAYTYQARDWVPGERLVMSTSEGPFPMETTYEWSDGPGGGTHMKLRNRGEPSGFGKIAAPMMTRAIRKNTEKDLKLLKSILEAG